MIVHDAERRERSGTDLGWNNDDDDNSGKNAKPSTVSKNDTRIIGVLDIFG